MPASSRTADVGVICSEGPLSADTIEKLLKSAVC